MLLKAVMVALAVCYPLLAHLAVLADSVLLTVASIAVLALLALLPGLLRGSVAAWLAAGVIGGALAVLSQQSLIWLPLYAPAVLSDLLVAWIFARTLLPQRVPLVERIVRLLHAPDESLNPAIGPYARRLTLAWAVLFGSLGAISLLFALLATPNGILVLIGVHPAFTVSQHSWSLFANFIEYLLVAGFFALEYSYRRQRFPEQPYANIFDFLRRMLAVAPEAIGSEGRRASVPGPTG
jgi:uncharacterized membrane protein